MIRAIKQVVAALCNLEQSLKNDEPLRRETEAIRKAFAARATAIKSLRKKARKMKPKPKPMLVELFMPRFQDIEAFVVELDLNKGGLDEWEWWRNVWNGTA